MNILGINAFHADSSAALIIDGQVVAAIEEERINRTKHWAGFPLASIKWCLKSANIGPDELDHIAISYNPNANWAPKLGFILRSGFGARKFLFSRVNRALMGRDLEAIFCEALNLKKSEVRAEFHNVEHHEAHIASGMPTSPFESSAFMSLDGMGDFVSARFGRGTGIKWEALGGVAFPHSLGLFYSALTMHLGFHNYGDEYKVMGLAPYGKPKYSQELRKIISVSGLGFELDLSYFKHHLEGIQTNWECGAPRVEPFASPKLEQLVGKARASNEALSEYHCDLAASLQRTTEDVICSLASELQRRTGETNLVLVGGVAMNSVANGKITERTPFTRVYVPPGAADNGGAIGCALYVWHSVLGRAARFPLRSAYLGPQVDNDECSAVLVQYGIESPLLSDDSLIETVATAIADGKIVGWYQGRMEFGARALGARSLLADPRNPDIRNVINLKIKHREIFRPFAPSILEEDVDLFFERAEPVPFMEKVLRVRESQRHKIPAVTHVDGTGRLQTVTERESPLYWRLIRAFKAKTGVPVILNTSLNENEPIVNSPKQALDCFMRTKMDAIALGSFWITREMIRQH